MSVVVEKSRMRFIGVEYEIDLLLIRRAMARVQVEEGVAGIKGWVPIMSRHRQTIWRLLSGKQVSLDSLRVIITPLGLRFDEVAKPVRGEAQAAAA